MSVGRILEVVKRGHTHLVKFDLEATYNMDEFRDFVTMKESNLVKNLLCIFKWCKW